MRRLGHRRSGDARCQIGARVRARERARNARQFPKRAGPSQLPDPNRGPEETVRVGPDEVDTASCGSSRLDSGQCRR